MSRKDSASGYEQGTVVMLVSLAQLLVAGCAGAPPVDCGCVETMPGVTPTGCVKNNVRGVAKLILKGFDITSSPYRARRNMSFNSRDTVVLYDQEIVMPQLEVSGISRRDTSNLGPGIWVQPICYAARIDNGPAALDDNFVDAGAFVFLRNADGS